MSLLFR